ncbi:nicotinate-nucleotide adenylyltransferase [Gemelliphila asaccharolytica]|uniref:Probable nicotinate-nucleotide adenylyltransferase n=1 Tax=Gemelliphila asaccharolytica TaxID=502393 RepID=A0ABR5TNK7_9BACL|nr:nicotinate-nucleotide adenylyltransferase [Gemella asaccharolytica]KXB59011.1 nicotinate-nucleotide adenylyltransferase [Gemella asaccharolytica]
MKILLFGGSFDPIHIGHIEAAKKAIEKLNIDKVIFIPTNQTPLKSNNLVASNNDRYNMILRSIKDNKKLDVSDYEIKKQDVSYTYNTVKHFKQIYKGDDLYFLIGTDRVKDLEKWYNIDKLKNLITFIFVPRNNENLEEIIAKNDFLKKINYVILELPIIKISSSYIREKLKKNKNIDDLIDKNCAKYIEELNLYEF